MPCGHIGKILPQRTLISYKVTVVTLRIFEQIVLMVLLRWPKSGMGNNLGDDGPDPLARGGDLGLDPLGDFSLAL